MTGEGGREAVPPEKEYDGKRKDLKNFCGLSLGIKNEKKHRGLTSGEKCN